MGIVKTVEFIISHIKIFVNATQTEKNSLFAGNQLVMLCLAFLYTFAAVF